MINEQNENGKVLYFSVLFAGLILSVLTIFNIPGIIRTIGLTIVFLLFLLSNKYAELLILLFLTGFAADISTTIFGIPFISFLQIIFIFKAFIKKRYVPQNILLLVGVLLFLQLPSLLFAGQTIVHEITFIINILMMFSISIFSEFSEEEYTQCMITFAVGIVVVLIASIVRDPIFFAGSYYRFKGIWTDQNFLAMFCVLATLALFYWMKDNRSRTIVAIILSAVLLYCAYRTYSMTFIFAAALLIVVIAMDFWKSRIPLSIRIVGIVLFLAISVFLFLELYNEIVNGRGRLVFSAGEDWTHGRFRDTEIVFDAWNTSIINILFGIGIDNSVAYTGYAAHNSYVEILAQFGLLGASVILAAFISFIRRYRVTVGRIIREKTGFVLILLMYMGTLSMQSTDVWYLFMGLFMCRFCRGFEIGVQIEEC